MQEKIRRKEGLRQKFNDGEKFISFTAELSEVYYKYDMQQDTILLKNIICEGNLIADHVWITAKDLYINNIAKNPYKYIGKKLDLQGKIIRYYHKNANGKMLDYTVTALRRNLAV